MRVNCGEGFRLKSSSASEKTLERELCSFLLFYLKQGLYFFSSFIRNKNKSHNRIIVTYLRKENFMDHMTIRTKFMKNLIAKIMKRTLKKKLGYEIDFELNDLEVTFDDGTGKAVINLNAKASMDKEELKKLIKDEM